MNLAENLKKIRKENNLSQEKLAEKLSVSRQSVSKWESGQAYPEMDKVLQLCKLFNISVDDLLNQDVSELNNNKAVKTNINKFSEDFLNCITKVVGLFSNLTFKEKIKCIFEQVLLILMFYLTSEIILSLFQPLVTHIFSFLPENAYIFVFNIIKDIATICLCILFIGVMCHIFKVRYLNYYVIENFLDDDNKKETNVDNVINDSFKVIKRQKIIIRDPKHTMYNFISSILKCVIFLMKLIMILVGLFVCISFVFFVSCLIVSFAIIKTGLLFIGLLLLLIGIDILLGQIIIAIFNFVTNRKNVVKRICIVFISSLILIGIGIGFITLSLPKFNYYNIDNDKYIKTSQEFSIDKNTVFTDSCEWSYNYGTVNYIEDERKNILIEVSHNKHQKIEIEKYNNYIYINNTGMQNIDFKVIRDFINEINNYKIINFDSYNKYKVNIYGNKENLELMKNRANNYCNGLDK